jgi:acyl transferase domain-containing protein
VGDPLPAPAAVIGMARPLPPRAESPDGRWAALLRGDDPVTEITANGRDAEESGERRSGLSRGVDY